ncbi:hypothetical protein DAI22_08g130401 [Oryza sativa Japonica Group]|nr:hypothetical protein DAI22_08g130401 [Oryza sativa Japonica Group]
MTTPMSLLSLSGLSLSWLSIYIHDPVLLGAAALAWRLLQYCLVAWPADGRRLEPGGKQPSRQEAAEPGRQEGGGGWRQAGSSQAGSPQRRSRLAEPQPRAWAAGRQPLGAPDCRRAAARRRRRRRVAVFPFLAGGRRTVAGALVAGGRWRGADWRRGGVAGAGDEASVARAEKRR